MSGPQSDVEVDTARAWRRRLHAHPELGFEEHETAAFVAARLEEFGLRVRRGVGGTGVIGVLDRGKGPRIGFRAELDALAIEEKANRTYKSVNPKRMHACGHDGHMAMLLAAASRLASEPGLKGTLFFIFQPAEEHGAGAEAMLRDGLGELSMSMIFALHNWPTLPVGCFALRTGPMMASEHNFEIIVRGRGGHASAPHTTADPIPPAAEIVLALQTIVSRRAGAFEPVVLSVTQIDTDGVRNVIPGQVRVRGDFRTLDDSTQQRVTSAIHDIVKGVCTAHGVEGRVTVTHDFVETTNDEAAVKAATKAAAAVSGIENVMTCDPAMASDDFGRLCRTIPGAYVLIGNGGDRASVCGLHNGEYDFNDDVLPLGEAFWVTLARDLCGRA